MGHGSYHNLTMLPTLPIRLQYQTFYIFLITANVAFAYLLILLSEKSCQSQSFILNIPSEKSMFLLTNYKFCNIFSEKSFLSIIYTNWINSFILVSIRDFSILYYHYNNYIITHIGFYLISFNRVK